MLNCLHYILLRFLNIFCFKVSEIQMKFMSKNLLQFVIKIVSLRSSAHYYFSRAGVSPNGDASTILNYLSTLVSVAQFDALSPYHPTSEGILAKLMKRPYHERSMENKNIAAIFAGRLLIHTVLKISRVDSLKILVFVRLLD